MRSHSGGHVIEQGTTVNIMKLQTLVACVLTVVACTRDRDLTGETTVTAAKVEPLSNEPTIERLASARCSRASDCKNVGIDSPFFSYDTCLRELPMSLRRDLGASACPLGVDPRKVETCLTEINNESCDNAVETLERVVACRRAEFCVAPPRSGEGRQREPARPTHSARDERGTEAQGTGRRTS